jgi:hypothetical protein
LNIVVEDSVVERLAGFQPTLEESAAGIVYPPAHQDIPRIRKAYWYYAAMARRGGRGESVLVRRAMVPVPRVVELFSGVSLMDTFNLTANDVVSVEVRASRRANATGA